MNYNDSLLVAVLLPYLTVALLAWHCDQIPSDPKPFAHPLSDFM